MSSTKETKAPSDPSVDMPATIESGSSLVNSTVVRSSFSQERAEKPLRVCCYGSSSAETPLTYLQSAAEVGYILAKRGHTCVNGAGTFGCMAAMNQGAAAGDGHIVGVIHKMWLVDGADVEKQWGIKALRDGGAHSVFDTPSTVIIEANGERVHEPSGKEGGGPVREMRIAGGKDLQERKKLLVEGADALIVLPGGPGTWDELWEMACARNIGLTKIPIVCVNIDGYYEPFRQMLDRADKDKLIKLKPEEIVHFVNSAEEAVQWCEEAQHHNGPSIVLKKREEALRSQSVLGSPIVESQNSFFVRSLSMISDW
eukprot:CAMPEP_0198139312 /NCGR_PEP_ID=MMETSP1443-20131203/2651_1 /TAXON_ID=186043 /ORGANISM="Entomoneis sp., Strain CCMP2396" /LENGTH=312 /DNA_ID=CAMNT_0043801417 /DNA_START=29 /DNA_END=964 /DNA_ORIENTATION=-